jgi:hypothetical protein
VKLHGTIYPSFTRAASAIVALSALPSCTGQLPGSFRYQQQVEKFTSLAEVNTTLDLLWVVDNSASMDVNQRKIRDGFSGFANRYLKPNWDIRLAVITTDTYMAHPSFDTYKTTTIPGSTNLYSNYLANRTLPFSNPASNPTLFNNSTKRFTNGIRYGELVPSWSTHWSRLLAGSHDGPTTSLCMELLPYFLNGVPRCNIRDAMTTAQGTTLGLQPCTDPDTQAGQSSLTGCVNTTQNDSIHSGKPILVTQPPPGVPGDSAWTQGLVRDFLVNISVGSSGQGSERGLGSVLQLLSDNETSATAFFRPGSLRVIIFVSDEEDQTLILPNPAPAGFTPQTHYQCDSARLAELNPNDARVSTQCPSSSFRCPEKTVNGLTYRVSYCPRGDAPLMPVQTVKDSLDSFFRTLDGSTQTTDPNYFVVGIIPTTATSIQQLQADREVEDTGVGNLKQWAVDRGDRYLELVNLVGNGSLTLDIGEPNYSPVLDAIGQAIVNRKATFTLARPAGALEDLLVWIEHSAGDRQQLSPNQFTVTGTTLQITDLDLVLSLSSTDKVVIDYQPSSL